MKPHLVERSTLSRVLSRSAVEMPKAAVLPAVTIPEPGTISLLPAFHGFLYSHNAGIVCCSTDTR